jgi:epoxyqueuosine reductase QueG
MNLSSEITGLSESLGADFYGVADLSPASKFILDQGGPLIAGFPRAISVGIALPHTVVDQLPDTSEPPVPKMIFRHHAYDVINQRLDHITSRLCLRLQKEGFRSFPVAASQTANPYEEMGIFSHKIAAHLSGLGWIVKNCLLITPQVGPRVRWASVPTHASLEITGQLMGEQCNSCQECVDICPVKAITGRSFRKEESRDARIAAHDCKNHLNKMKEKTGWPVCSLCLYICPYGREASKKAQAQEQS